MSISAELTHRRSTPTLTLRERNDIVRVENGDLIILSEEFYACGSSKVTSLRISIENEIRLERQRWMNFPIDADEKQVLRYAVDADLAKHLRISAMPLIAAPTRGLELGVDAMFAFAEEQLPRPYLLN